MYCSMRFYINNIGILKNTSCIFKVLSLLSTNMKLPCKLVEYMLLNPDTESDYTFYNKSIWDGKGDNPFVVPCPIIIMGKNGDIESPCAFYFDKEKAFPDNKIMIHYPLLFSEKQFPMVIGIDFKICRENRSCVSIYKQTLHDLLQLKMTVDNSFVHVYSMKEKAGCLDGMQSGWSLAYENQLLKHYLKHAAVQHKGHIMDAFFANSIDTKYLARDAVEEIKRIVGSENVSYIGNSVVFSLPHADHPSVMYRLYERKRITALRKCLLGH